jgi:hypothetical protein
MDPGTVEFDGPGGVQEGMYMNPGQVERGGGGGGGGKQSIYDSYNGEGEDWSDDDEDGRLPKQFYFNDSQLS